MKKNTVFTLIELLAVIIILAVIALIITPIVTGIISKAKDSADLRSAEGYVKAGEDYYAASTLKNSPLDTNVIDNLELSARPATGSVVVHSDGGVEMAIVINNKCYKKNTSDSIKDIEVTTDLDNCKVYPTIYATVLSSYPELEVGDSGCKNLDTNKNYSYMGGCYLKGAQTKNYLWYSGFVWRIMGINKDKTIKLITEEDVTGISYNIYNTSGNSNFDGSYEDDWLNDYFYSRLKGNNIIVANDFCQGAAVTSAPSRTDCTGGTTLSRNVGLLSIDEYNLASSVSSYLNNNQYFWAMSPYSASFAWYVDYDGYFGSISVSSTFGTRPVINVNSTSSITSGDGTLSSTWSSISSPYILNDDKTKDVKGSIADKVTSGEYVKLAGKTYRVVNKESNGVKLILDGYYQSTAGTTDTMIFGSNNTFSTTSGIGQTLNTTILDWLIPSTDTTNRSKLVTNYSWYQNNFVNGDNYTVSLEETSPTRTISATVGLIRIGEMLSGQSYTILTKNGTAVSSSSNSYDYWALNSYKGDASSTWFVLCDGDSRSIEVSNTYGARPVIVVNNSTQITSGTGTPSSPYQI